MSEPEGGELRDVTITCGHCGKDITRPLKWFSEEQPVCPECGATFKPDATRQSEPVNGSTDKPKQN